MEGEKKSWKSTSVHVQRLKFLVCKPRLGSKSNSCNTREFSSYSSAKVCLFQTFCIISSVLFPFKLLLVSLPTLPPTLQQINIAWLVMWSTLHVSLYCKALCITTTGDWKRGKEKRGIYKCLVVFNASYKKKKTHEVLLFYAIARYLAEPKLGKGNFNKSLGSWKLVREMQKVTKKCLKYFKHVLPLFHIVRKNPLKKLKHQLIPMTTLKSFCWK